jgi:hypothetical protein
MSSRFNNRLLLIILVGLLSIFLITRFTKVRNTSKTLRTDLVSIDTSQVTEILLYPTAEKGAEIQLLREGNQWNVSNSQILAAADKNAVLNMLGELGQIKAQQLVTRSGSGRIQYQVNDSLGTRVMVKEGKKTSLDLVVGRFHYEPAPGGYNMYGQNQGTAKTYVRLTGEDEIYSTEGFLAMSINQNFSRWRDQAITRISKSQLSRISFDYPADSGFVAQKSDGGWMVAGLQADSASLESYLNSLSRVSHQEFADGFQATGDPDYSVTFEGDNMKSQQVKAFLESDSLLILQSSYNPNSFFRVKRSGKFADLFPGADKLITSSE